ncbi:MAG: glycosyltransferase family 2 protein [Candidatus Bathyarchaeota archaeon]|nr:glycosyltransferase family 2 protein [Candidatus Bathyarchaeota archaeon]
MEKNGAGPRGWIVADISVFIPVYKESQQLLNILEKLIAQDNINKEIFVTIDEPETQFLEKILRFIDVKFIINKKRIGKANALNNSVKLSTGQVLLFLDADLELPDDPNFLKKIIDEMRHTDVLDIKKRVIRNSFLSKMTYYEYFTFNISAWIASEYLRKCPATNGAAFAIRRETFEAIGGFTNVVAEDLDIATRAFLKGYSFAYTKTVEVLNVVHSSWRKWFKQRRRWAIGQALWLKGCYKELFRECMKKPQIFLPGLFFLYPSLAMFFLTIMVPSSWLQESVVMLSFLLSIKFNIALPVFLASLATADLLKALLISLVSFAVTAITFYIFSRKLTFEIKLHELFVYYFFYSIAWLAIIAIGYIQVLVFKKKAAPDWVT